MKKSRYRIGIWLSGFISALCLAGAIDAANFTVNSSADAAGSCPGANCTLREAIGTAVGGDTISFSLPANSAITLTSTELLINKNLTITGPGANLLTVQRSTAAGTPDLRIFHIVGKFNVTFSGLTIRAGNLTANDIGGGIYNEGANVTARDCTIADNVVGFGGAGVNNRADGQSSTVQLFNCTVSNNTGKASAGGIINLAANGGNASMSLVNCTVSGNTGASLAGGIGNGTSNGGTASLSIFNCTFSGNTPGALYVGGTTEMGNTILKRGASGANIVGTITSRGHNLSDDAAGGDASTGPGGTLNATGDQRNTDPRLGPLQNNGGPTFTHNLFSNSPARDAGDDAVLGPPLNLMTDQRGFPRRVGSTTDIGAVEVGLQQFPQSGTTLTVTNTDEHDDGNCTVDDCTLLEAINAENFLVANASTGPMTINFIPGLRGAIGTANLTPTGLAISEAITINGPGARVLTITGRTSARVFRVLGAKVNISGLSIVNGKATNDQGGAISNTGSLTLTDCTITNSSATGTTTTTGNGGGVYNALGASLMLTRCTVSGSSAGRVGGGISNEGILAATNCTFSGDSAIQGGGIYSAFSNNASKVSLRNCTITLCAASDAGTATGDGGGGFYAVGNSGQYNLGNTIIAGNTATTNPDLRGNFSSDGHNFIGNVGFSSGLANNVNGDQVGTSSSLKNAQLDALKNNGGPTDTHAILSASTARDNGDNALAPPTDQRGYFRSGVSDIGAFEFNGLVPPTLANISTRLRVETGDNVLIGGFIVTGTQPKKIIVRAIGPSLPFADKLADPILELHDSSGALLETNDNWMDSPNKQAIIDSTIPPNDPLESAIVRSVAPGNYTAIERGVNNGTGIGVVEAYDLDTSANSKLANISTRGLVQTGDNVLFAGTIVVGQASQKVIIRALGPSTGVPGAMADPTLELYDGNGALLEANDNWVDSPNKQAIIDSTIPPPNNAESAIVRTLTPANYTAIVRGANNSTGIAVVEVYALN
jgi:CSLREA domain-containing protein